MIALLFISLMLLGCVLDTREQENAGMTIPESLRECYQNPDLYSRDKRLPMTMSTLIKLIRKVELYKGSYFDMRGLTIALLHRFRMDGIERIPGMAASAGIVPFRLTGSQFTKHRIILQNLVPGNAYAFPNESLTAQELCTLHFMLSSGVEPWERGDESEVCPYNLHDPESSMTRSSWHLKRVLIRDPAYPLIRIQGAQLSRCPIEEGVVYTSQWGTVNVGTVLGAIAAALQPQQVPISLILKEPEQVNDTIKMEKFDRYRELSLSVVLDNTWVTTLAGDLAEVAVFQGPRLQDQMYIGPPGEWNDTVIPRILYMDQRNHGLWHMTDAEARGGIDGLILASIVQSWEEQMNRLRLSQLLEMYYSAQGVNFATEYRACERYSRFRELMTESDLLEPQTINFARVLSYNSLDAVQISDEKLEEFSQNAVRRFESHLSNILSGLHCETSESYPRVHLIVVLDGTWTKDEGFRVLAQLAEDCDVSYYGSSMAVMNGEDASWILEETHNAFELFKHQNNTDNSSTVTWPRSLNLKLSLGTLYSYLASKVAEERRMKIIGDLSYVILVLGYSATISNEDFDRSVEIIRNYKNNNADVRFVYLASEINQNRFKQLSTIDDRFTDKVIISPESSVEMVVSPIINSISAVPGRLMSAYCDDDNGDGFEDYVTPEHSKVYRIHPKFLLETGKISLHLTGSGYGDLSVCISREEFIPGTDCKELKGTGEVKIDISSPCLNYVYCPPLFVTISVTSSATRCSEDDCRFPDQVRFLMYHEGLRCPRDPNDSSEAHILSYSLLTLFIQIVAVSFFPIVRSLL